MKLAGQEAYRIRAGDYRVIYEIHDRVLVVLVLNVGHRRECDDLLGGSWLVRQENALLESALLAPPQELAVASGGANLATNLATSTGKRTPGSSSGSVSDCGKGIKWSGRGDLNSRLAAWEAATLPTELRPLEAWEGVFTALSLIHI